MTSPETFRGELQQVMSRHSELFGDRQTAAEVAAILLASSTHALRPRSVEMEVETHSGRAALVAFPGADAAAIIGSHQPGDWLDEMTVDVSDVGNVEVGAPDR